MELDGYRLVFVEEDGEARSRGCTVVELDSGVQRRDAHRFYHRQGMTILGYHFSIDCGERA